MIYDFLGGKKTDGIIPVTTSLIPRQNLLVSRLNVAYTENERQLVAEGVSPPAEAAAFFRLAHI